MGFGENLVKRGLITREQHELALGLQSKNRLVGQIAIEQNYLSEQQVSEVLEYTDGKPDIYFGEAAISMGLLTLNQVRYILDCRTKRKVRIGDILVRIGAISSETLHQEVMRYDAKRKRLRNILVCEPSKTVSLILERWLKKYGYFVHVTRTGEEAYKLAKEIKPDIFMVSSVLEDITGIKLCYKLLSDPSTAGARLILISGRVEPKEIDIAFEVGVNHFLTKPIKEDELINIIYQLEREESDKKPEKILIVDDSPGARMIIFKELSTTWANIYMAKDGKEGVEKAKAILPDIITMDVEMPLMNGLEACRSLKEDPATEDIPVIMISSQTTQESRARGFEVGAVEYFSKPFGPGLLTEFMKMLVEAKKISKREKILIVEDSKITRHILKYFFEKNGFSTTTVPNGVEALVAIPEINPDIIITDCYMPLMDGFTFAREMKKQKERRHIPIIMLTASTAKSDVLKGLAAGASDYISKPFDESELLARVDVHLKNQFLLAQLEEEKEKLQKANEEKDKFIGIAAHDLRNPLVSIKSFASMIASNDYDEETKEKFLEIITTVSEEMLDLLEDLLDISTIESGKVFLNLETHNIGDVVQNRVLISGPMAKNKEITINFLGSLDIDVVFDLQKIEQVIDNLVSNAIKYTKPGKNIYVSIEDYPTLVKVVVKDEGLGIPDEEISKLFIPFSKLSVKATAGEKSTGLGLSIASKIVKAHSGKIGVESKVDAGSEFYFTLPKKDAL
ncbi:hypothetical protein MNBD_NITROSPINAE02-621 [hydrothermal vent metagenome]|uniref:histidine kinase n=1 Tax=hydrothermal vent metagenome TaxID=652676 RepID=A0A3B1BTR6_9ZZZZ